MIEKEVEVKIIDYSLDELNEIVKKSGAVFLKEERQVNYLFKTKNLDESSYLRLRVTDEYSEFTLKTRLGDEGARTNKEVTTRINDSKSFLEIMDSMGINYVPQSKIRHKYVLDEYVFDLDVWDKNIYPYPYLEIEASSKSKLESLIKKLDIPSNHITTKSIGELIKELENKVH